VLALVDDVDDSDAEDDGLGGAVGESVTPLLKPGFEEPSAQHAKRRTALIDGFSLHADVEVAADDRAALERLLRYGARPPFSHRRFAWTPSGKVSYRLRRPWYTGQTHLVLEPVALLRRLALLIPPPRQNQVRFHGAFAPNAKCRRALVELVPASERSPPKACLTASANDNAASAAAAPSRLPPATRLSWAQLFARVFAKDVTVCPTCAAPMKVLAVVTAPDAIRRVLAHLELPLEPPAIAAARAPPEPELELPFDTPADADPFDVA
jgi:hypothetical protein